MLNVNGFLSALLDSKLLSAVIDFVMLLCWAVMYFCVMLAYKNGEYRFLDSLITIFSFLLYTSTVYKLIGTVFNKFGKNINKIIKKLLRKLKIGEKSLKKLLHFHR